MRFPGATANGIAGSCWSVRSLRIEWVRCRQGLPFSNRGIPDTLCYARLIGSPLENEIFTACDRCRYMVRVFLAPPWQEIYTTDTERKQTYDEVIKTYGLMVEAYEDCGYDVVEIPRASPTQRADFILDMLSSVL
jgi:predicted ATPase